MSDISNLETEDLLMLMKDDQGLKMVEENATIDQLAEIESLLIDIFAGKHAGHENLVHWEATINVH
jgi:hypothetical protein